MKNLPTAPATGHCTAQCALAAAALFLGACSATTGSLKNATERHGQVQFSSGKEQIVGEIAIRHTDESFQATITKGPGVPLLTISAKFAVDLTGGLLPFAVVMAVTRGSLVARPMPPNSDGDSVNQAGAIREVKGGEGTDGARRVDT